MSSTDDERRPEHAIDRDTSTYCNVNSDTESWMTLTLKRRTYITRVVYFFYVLTNIEGSSFCKENENQYLQCMTDSSGIKIAVRSDEEKVKQCGLVELKYGGSYDDQMYIIPCEAYGNEVRLSKNGRFSVAEIMIFILGKIFYFPYVVTILAVRKPGRLNIEAKMFYFEARVLIFWLSQSIR